MQGQGQCQYLKNIQYMSQCVARRGVPEHQLPIDRETGMRGKYTPVSRRLQIADLQLAPYDLNEASTLRGRQHSGQVRHSQVRQRQELLSRCQLSFKRVTPVMAQRRTGLSDYTVANQRQPDTRHVLSREQAIRVYDRAGAAIKDSSSVYGGPATKALLQAAELKSAKFVFEFGSGSGGLADLLLSTVLHAECQYHAVDQSSVQVELTQQRLKRHGDRAHVRQISGDLTQAAKNIPDGAVDVFLSTYVLDILSDQDIGAVLCLAHRLVRPGGQMCLVGLTFGDTPLSKLAIGKPLRSCPGDNVV
ncbi:TPA: hypothetical protein ACH3X3_010409 [Trebouxia sp. C0006]